MVVPSIWSSLTISKDASVASQDKAQDGEMLGYVVAVVLAWDRSLIIIGLRIVEWTAFGCLGKWKQEAQRSPIPLRHYESQRPPWQNSRKAHLQPRAAFPCLRTRQRPHPCRCLTEEPCSPPPLPVCSATVSRPPGRRSCLSTVCARKCRPSSTLNNSRAEGLSLQTRCSHMVRSRSQHWLRFLKRMVVSLVPISAYMTDYRILFPSRCSNMVLVSAKTKKKENCMGLHSCLWR